jgi:predicted DsbA family dithiol-disulfide isomerase
MHGKHAYAEILAMACEAADKQGKYAEMYHAMYKNLYGYRTANEDQVIADITRTAASLGMDGLQFRADMQSPEVSAAIDRQIAVGNKFKVMLTPTFWIVGPDGKPKSLGSFEATAKWMEKPGNLK